MGKSIREIMTSNPSTVQADATVVDAARVMRDDDTGIVPIVENERLVATITDRDIDTRVVLFFPTRGCGCIEHPAFPTPLFSPGRTIHASLGRRRVAGMRRCG